MVQALFLIRQLIREKRPGLKYKAYYKMSYYAVEVNDFSMFYLSHGISL